MSELPGPLSQFLANRFERERIVERTKEGLAAAKRRSRVGGRPRALSEEARQEIIRMHDRDRRPVSEIARTFKVSRATVYRINPDNS